MRQTGGEHLIKIFGSPVRHAKTGRPGIVTIVFENHDILVTWDDDSSRERLASADLIVNRHALRHMGAELARKGGLSAALGMLAGRIGQFDNACERNEHTDTAEAWDLLHSLQRQLEDLRVTVDLTNREIQSGDHLGPDALVYALLRLPPGTRLQLLRKTAQAS
jgi:hypothetical protein